MTKLPVFEYVDYTSDRTEPSKEEKLKMSHKIYVFCKLYKTNKLIFRNMANGYESEMKINVNGIAKLLKKEGLIN